MALQERSGGRKPRNIHIMAITVCLLVIVGLLIDAWSDRQAWQVLQSSVSDGQSELAVPGTKETRADLEKNMEASIDLETSSALIPIYLVGAVRRPGIYQVEPGCYLYQLVEQAGGLTEKAAANQINLVMRLDHNQQIYIPTSGELAENPALLPDQSDQHEVNPLVDLNRAMQADLEKLPGIGPVTAKAILNYREKNGPFTVPEDLMLVPGIKESRFAALEDFIMVSAPSE